MEAQVVKVKSSANVKNVAGCIVGCFENGSLGELHCMGASSVNQMVKSVAVARSILSAKGKDIALVPGFIDVQEKTPDGKNEKRTVIVGKIVELR